MKTKLFTIAFFFAVLISSVQISAQETFKLNYKLEKGKTFYYRTVSSGETIQTSNDQDIATQREYKTKTRYEITDVTNETYAFIASADSFYSNRKVMDEEAIINNGEGIAGKKTKMIYSLLGKKLHNIRIDPIESLTSIDLTRGADILFQLSDKPVKIGDEWTTTGLDTNKVMGDGRTIVKSDITYKVEGKENKNGANCLKISFNGVLKYNGTSSTQGVDLAVEGTGKVIGAYYFDLTKCIVNSVEYTTTDNSIVSVPQVSQEIPVKGNTKTTTILLEK